MGKVSLGYSQKGSVCMALYDIPLQHGSPLPPHPPAAAAAPWDEITFVRLPPFERHEAKQLVIYGIHERIKARKAGLTPAAPVPMPTEPTTDEALAIERDYKNTISFLLDAVGCRPRRLLACLAKATPMTDAELQDEPPLMPGECRRIGTAGMLALVPLLCNHTARSLLPFADPMKAMLPPRLHGSALERESVGCSRNPALECVCSHCSPSSMLLSSFAANVATALMGELGHFERAVTEMLAVASTLVLPPSTSPAPTPGGERLIERVDLVDKLLRQLLSGPQRRVAVEVDFTGRKAVLERLMSYVSQRTQCVSLCCQCMLHPLLTRPTIPVHPHAPYHLQHILFLDGSPKAGTIAYESDAIRDIASNILSSDAHLQRMELAHALLEWQEASSNVKARAEEPRSIWGWVGDSAGFAASDVATARKRVWDLEARIKTLRGKVAGVSAVAEARSGSAVARATSGPAPVQPAADPAALAAPAHTSLLKL